MRIAQKPAIMGKEEIRKAVADTWKTVTVGECAEAQKRVIKNMRKAIDLKGGNFYKEGGN